MSRLGSLLVNRSVNTHTLLSVRIKRTMSCVKIRAVTGAHVAERAGSNAAAAQEESTRLPGAAKGDGPNVSGRSLCPEFGATRGGAAASGGSREVKGQPAAVPSQSSRQGTMLRHGSQLLLILSRCLIYGTSKFTAVFTNPRHWIRY
jgi:hypothetical protein